ncbi:hypothetical protein DF011_05365 [Burkholderia ubonensis]|nr:hypothetical protein CJO70_21450 [Burkholderia ubonensis]PAK05887.1 hypothetical protein CJO67_20655 [Burkholderia ubonensis]RQP88598.1 hypothetical protein DF014_05355 [Burkholderia ubonensis]RQQ17327.1 hypothetical protein DF011_05365 [Burkholderia ubonensis]
MQVTAGFGHSGCVSGLFASTKRRIVIVRFDDGFVSCLEDMLGIGSVRFPFVEFIDRNGGRVGRRRE